MSKFHHLCKMKYVFSVFFIALIIFVIFFNYQTIKLLIEPKSKVPVKMKLPEPTYHSQVSIEQALKQRRSNRKYTEKSLSLNDVSQLLWACQGITSPQGFRTAPSAGALYPLTIYLISGQVEKLDAGIYQYQPNEHSITLLAKGDIRQEIANKAYDQVPLKQGAATIVIAADYTVTTAKYGHRGKRFVHMEAGHAAQNIYLQAVSLGLGTVTMGAFNDREISTLLNLPKHIMPLYLIPIGHI